MTERYIHKNLLEVPDRAAAIGSSESQESHFASADFGSPSVGFTYHHIKPGKRQGAAHRHKQAEEFYVVMAGTGRLKLDDQIFDVGRLDAFRVAPDVWRAWEAGPDGLEVLSFGARVNNDKDAVPSDGEPNVGWWTD